jgi:hypothetical protein
MQGQRRHLPHPQGGGQDAAQACQDCSPATCCRSLRRPSCQDCPLLSIITKFCLLLCLFLLLPSACACISGNAKSRSARCICHPKDLCAYGPPTSERAGAAGSIDPPQYPFMRRALSLLSRFYPCLPPVPLTFFVDALVVGCCEQGPGCMAPPQGAADGGPAPGHKVGV